MFSQNGNDIYLKFPNGAQPIPFYHSTVIPCPHGKQVKGSKGIQMIEQAYAVHRENHYGNRPLAPDEIAGFTNIPALHDELGGGECIEFLETMLPKNQTLELSNKEQIKKIIKKHANDTNVMLGISFSDGKHIFGRWEGLINESRYLYSNHQYAIKNYDPEKNMCYLTNPWNSSTLIEVPMNDLMSYNINSFELGIF